MRIVPACGATTPASRLSNVDLPLPLGPRTKIRSPRATRSDATFTAGRAPAGQEKTTPDSSTTISLAASPTARTAVRAGRPVCVPARSIAGGSSLAAHVRWVVARPALMLVLVVLAPTIVVRIEHLRHHEIVRIDQQAELGPLFLREAHVERRLAPVDLVIHRRARLRDVGQM